MECKYCGKEAKYIIWNKDDCCSPTAKQCPGYSKWFGNIVRKIYKDNPEQHKLMSRRSKEVHNRPEVKEKKRQSMKELHNGSTIECLEFQNNYTKGRKKFNELLRIRYTNLLKEYGINTDNYSNEKLKIMVRRLKYYTKRGDIDNGIKVKINRRIN